MTSSDDPWSPNLAARPLHQRIHELIDRYEGELQQSAQTSDEARALWTLIQRWAAFLLHAATEIASPDAFPHVRKEFDELFEMGEESIKSWLDLITIQLSIVFGRLGGDLTRDGTYRVIKLYEVLSDLKPSRRAAAFLQRVSRCYVFGLDPECVVLCRSVLDAEFEAEISNDDCVSFLRHPSRYVYLDDRIRAAVSLGRITPNGEALARQVKNAANHAVHREPSVCRDALPTIRDTMLVLSELLPG